MDSEKGEAFIDEAGFKQLFKDDTESLNSLFLVAEIDDNIVGFISAAGNKLKRKCHRKEFGDKKLISIRVSKIIGGFRLKKFFEYNWQVRDEWFGWFKQLKTDELNKKRIGGIESILHTLFHITEVDYSWVRGIQGKEDIEFKFSDYDTLEKVKFLSDELRNEISNFLKINLDNLEKELVSVPCDKEKYTIDKILHHIVAHEIHHIGQLSVWSRELNLVPVQANFIGRNLVKYVVGILI